MSPSRLTLAALALIASSALANAQASTLRLSHQFAEQTDARDQGARRVAEEAAKRAPGLHISVYAKSSLGIGPVEQYDALLDGRIEMAVLPLFYVSPRVPQLSIALLPGVPANEAQAAMLKGTDFHRRLQELCESRGFHILTWWWLKGGIVSTRDAISGADGMKGVKVRGGDAIADAMFAGAGASTVVIPSTEIVAEMSAGRLELAQTSLESLLSMQIHTVTHAAVIGGNSLYFSLQPLVISTQAWASLTEAERAALEAAADLAEPEFTASQAQVEARAIESFTKAGVKVRPMAFEEYEGWLKVAHTTSWATYRALGTNSAELFQAMLQNLIDAPAKK